MPGLFIAGQKIKAGRGGILARGRRVTATATTTTELGVLRIDTIAVFAGRCYRIWTTPLNMDGTVDGDMPAAQIRFTTNGTAATTASAVLPGSSSQYRQAANLFGEHVGSISTTYTPGANQTLSLLLTVRRVAGTGNISMYADSDVIIEMVIEDIGVDPGDTGTDI